MEKIIRAMQAQSWERAKAELHSISAVDYCFAASPESRKEWEKKCDKRERLINKFIKSMEDEELYL